MKLFFSEPHQVNSRPNNIFEKLAFRAIQT